jgi:hypothetical protein
MLQIVGELFPEAVHDYGSALYTQAEHQQAAHKGFTQALRNCGDLPRVVTLEEFEHAIRRAEREATLALDLWAKWSRHGRPLPEGKRLELGSVRLSARHEVSAHIAEVRRQRLAWVAQSEGCA